MDTLTPRGPFSLKAAAEFGFGPSEGRVPAFDGVMRLAFAVDGGVGYAAATLRQSEPDAPVHVELATSGGADARVAVTQVARILSLDHDGEAFLRVGERDPVIGRLQAAHPGQRPVLFHSPYEAAAWAIISARRPSAQGAQVRQAIAEQYGARFAGAGLLLAAFPQPARLVDLPLDTPGLSTEKVQRLRNVAEAALRGELDVERLHALGPEAAYEAVQTLKGIGPFYASLVVLRASGFADAPLLVTEPKVLQRTCELYGLDGPPKLEQFREISDQWRPFRTWATVLVRLGGDRAARTAAAAAGSIAPPASTGT
jgi:DNA-3-methyladenine glycosylase II